MGLFGASELAKIVALRATEMGLEVGCLCDTTTGARTGFLNIPVVHDVRQAPSVDVWMLTDLANPAAALATLGTFVGSE